MRCDLSRRLLARLAAPLLLLPAGTAPADQVVWSDGETREGVVRLAGEGGLRLHDGRRLHQWPLQDVASLAFHPVTQRLERAWRFIEAGRTAKERTGESYPVVELGCVAALRDGRVVAGHLLTTVFLLEETAATSKVVVRAKLRGKEGQTPADLRYPARIVRAASPPPPAGGGGCRVSLEGADAGGTPELALVMRRPVTAAMAVSRRDPCSFACQAEGEEAVWAVRDGARIVVGWTGGADDRTRARVAAALREARDFFDGRHLLAVAADAADPETVFSLVLFFRERPTTLDAGRSLPWRLEVLRWRLSGDGQDQWAARAVLFRGIRAPGEPLPRVVLEPRWAELRPQGDVRLALP